MLVCICNFKDFSFLANKISKWTFLGFLLFDLLNYHVSCYCNVKREDEYFWLKKKWTKKRKIIYRKKQRVNFALSWYVRRRKHEGFSEEILIGLALTVELRSSRRRSTEVYITRTHINPPKTHLTPLNSTLTSSTLLLKESVSGADR